MKALTLWQPWAQLVAIGAKRLETRSWSTTYRGPIAIHAAKGFPVGARAMVETEPFWSALRAELPAPGPVIAGRGTYGFRYHEHNLPRAAIVATARLATVCEIVPAHSDHPRPFLLIPTGPITTVSEGVRALFGASPSRPFPALELAFGDFTPGRFAWVLEDVKLLNEPIPATGRQGLWEWVPKGPTTADPTTATPPPCAAPPPPTTTAPAPEPRTSAPVPAAPMSLLEGMVQMAARDPRIKSGFIDVRMAFLRSFAKAVLETQEATR